MKRFVVTITPRKGGKQRIETWASSATQATKQVYDYFLCPPSICTAESRP